jgi:hypothetical protein
MRLHFGQKVFGQNFCGQKVFGEIFMQECWIGLHPKVKYKNEFFNQKKLETHKKP